MSKTGDNRERRAEIDEAEREGMTAGEAGASTGASKQAEHEVRQKRRRDNDDQGKPG